MAENEPITVITGEEGHWSESIVGDNAERKTAMEAFETPDAFFAANDLATDWRRGIAGDDDKYYADLQRFSTPQDYGNSFREAQQTIRSGNLKAALKDDATEEDVSAYREANGIPAEAAGYMENLPDGLVLGENDKEIFGNFAESLHSINAPPEVAHKALEWYNGFAQREQDAIAEMDGTQSQETDDLLRGEWGSDYRANLNLVNGLIASTFGEEASDQLLNGRFADGRAFMNDPNVLKGLASLARKINPVMEMGGNDIDATQALNDEIAEIEKFMSEHRTEYLKDEPKQARLRQLYTIRKKRHREFSWPAYFPSTIFEERSAQQRVILQQTV